MPKSLRIATWNLERPRLRGWKKICLSTDWAKRVNQVNIWQGFTPDGKPASDHQGVYIDVF